MGADVLPCNGRASLAFVRAQVAVVQCSGVAGQQLSRGDRALLSSVLQPESSKNHRLRKPNQKERCKAVGGRCAVWMSIRNSLSLTLLNRKSFNS